MVRAVPGYFKRAPCLVLAGPLCRRGAARGRVMATTGGVSSNQGGAREGPQPVRPGLVLKIFSPNYHIESYGTCMKY